MTEKERILILGAGLMQAPAINAAKELGYETAVVDANPSAPSVPLADIFENIDLKDRNSLLEFAEKLNEGNKNRLKAVFTAGTDFSANVAFLAGKFGLVGHTLEAAENASNKVRMRKCFEKFSVPSPEFEEIDEEKLKILLSSPEKPEFPKVIKPVDNMGGRGCRLVRSFEEFEESAVTAIKNSRTHKAIFENFMDGKEFSIDALVWNGSLTITGFADRHIYFPPYFIETGHTMPSTVPEKIKLELISVFALGIKALGLTCGAAKADIKYTKNGPMIGEIAARLSGGYMSGWTFPYSSGFNLTKEALLIALGKTPESLLKERVPLEWKIPSSVKNQSQPFELFEIKSDKTSAERAWISIPGKVKSVENIFCDEEKSYGIKGLSETDEIADVLPRSFAGDEVDFPKNNVEKCGNVITVSGEYGNAVRAAENAVSSIVVRLEPFNKKTDEFLFSFHKKDEYGNIFPPPAFNIGLSEKEFSRIEFKDIPENKKAVDFIPCGFEKFKDSLRDFNFRTFKDSLLLFDFLCPEHKTLDGKTFWTAFVNGSVQGALYAADFVSASNSKKQQEN